VEALNLELAKKTALLNQAKEKLKKVCFDRRDINRDEDWAEYLTSIIKEKDRLLEEKTIEANRLTERERE
jgi:single-stranded DNA-specific DHH superfamily exonuclease